MFFGSGFIDDCAINELGRVSWSTLAPGGDFACLHYGCVLTE